MEGILIVIFIPHIILFFPSDASATKFGFTIHFVYFLSNSLCFVHFLLILPVLSVIGLFFYKKNEWCELLFKNNTVTTHHKGS